MDNWDGRNLSPALLLAQQKLKSLRDHYRAQESFSGPRSENDGRAARPILPESSQQQQLPDHLGWGSIPLTRAIRRAQGQEKRPSRKNQRSGPAFSADTPRITSPPEPAAEPSSDTSQVKLYPDLALGMLRQKIVTTGRIWLLLQHIDSSGRGWLDEGTAREKLTQKDSALQVCGRRQLRKLLARGDGVLWTRSKNRIWLRSAAKIAAALGVSHLRGRPVALPIAVLLEGVGTVRAHFYASFHSGRTGKRRGRADSNSDRARSGPLSRATLHSLSNVKPCTQRHYEKRAKVQRQPNFVVTRQSNIATIQEQAWERGRAWFRFTDYAGKHGKKGTVYSAWQLPNSYIGPHEQQPIGRQKRINQELADLFMEGMTGNGKDLYREVDNSIKHVRHFHNTGSAAAVSYNRHPDSDVFWRSRLRLSGQYEMWHYLPGQGAA